MVVTVTKQRRRYCEKEIIGAGDVDHEVVPADGRIDQGYRRRHHDDTTPLHTEYGNNFVTGAATRRHENGAAFDGPFKLRHSQMDPRFCSKGTQVIDRDDERNRTRWRGGEAGHVNHVDGVQESVN